MGVGSEIPAGAGLREQPFQMTPMFIRLSHQTNRRLAKPAVDPPTRLLDGERSWERAAASVLRRRNPVTTDQARPTGSSPLSADSHHVRAAA